MIKKKKWTKKETFFLKKNYLLMNNFTLAKRLNKTSDGISAKLIRIGLRRPKGMFMGLKGELNHMFGRTKEKNPFYKKKHTKSTKQKISKANKGKLVGNTNPASWRKGKTYEEIFGIKKAIIIKKNMSKARKGKLIGERNHLFGRLGEKNYFYGHKHNEETKNKVRNSNYHKNLNLHNNPRWNGGTSFEPYSFDWTKELKEKIRNRDNHKCVLCSANKGKKGFALDVHHIDYDKKNCSETNLITLCSKCHSKTNSNRKYWIKKLRLIVVETFK